jgi:hypothetical protein
MSGRANRSSRRIAAGRNDDGIEDMENDTADQIRGTRADIEIAKRLADAEA